MVGTGQNVGGLVGQNHSPISDSYSSGAVRGGAEHVGGLVGHNGVGGAVTGSRAEGTVRAADGADRLGGLVGYNEGEIAASVATGAVTGTAGGAAIGGLVGHNEGGPISGSAATGAVRGGQQVGGLVGHSDADGRITESWASGAVTAIADASVPGSGTQVGGLVGWNQGPVGASFATGNVTGAGQAGGLIGQNEAEIVATYATGNVRVSASASCPDALCRVAGGLIGLAKKFVMDTTEASNVETSYSAGRVSGPSGYHLGGLVGAAERATDPAESSAIFTNSNYSGATADSVAVSVTDAGVSVSEASLTILEGGDGTYTIVLDSEPTADVTVTINDPTDNTDVTVAPADLTFTSTTWKPRRRR